LTSETTFGRYRLLERLGEGGMAEVFKAKSFGVEGFEKVLVIKRILPKLAEHSKFVDMFVHEAKLAVRLSHANIVQVFDLGRVDHPTGELTSYFIAMEYVPGLDLATVLARCRKQKIAVPFGMAVFITAEVAKALDHAHRRRDEQSRPLGIVHRDISPQNVLLSWEGEVKVTDFGIAKARDSITDEEAHDSRAGRVRGKLAYMSPEQARAAAVDGRSDLFSLGTVLYEMIAGSNPFAAPTSFETVRRLQAGEYPPLELLRADAPGPLGEIIRRMLAKSADDRFPDAGKLHEHLLGFFYASGERFGTNNLAEFLEQFHEDHEAPELQSGVVFDDEQTGANDRTPVEVPQPAGGLTRTGNAGPLPVTADRGATTTGRAIEMGERREVTLLVLSFAGAERSREGPGPGPSPLTARARAVLARYGAMVLEQEGAQMIALFGLGDADGRDTEAAVRAALVIVRSGGALVSAGIHVARILVGAEGAPTHDERLASLIATAQALSRATEGQVAVSPLAGRIIRAAFTTEDLPATSGGPSSEGGRTVTSARAPAAVYGRFFGRHDELRRLGDILASATRRKAQLTTLRGDKGIGKTRLLAEMERRLAKGNYNVGFYTASCPKNGAGIPWSALTAMLHVLCGIQEGDDEERILDVLPRLRALGLHPDESSAVLAQLGATLADGAPQEETSVALRAAFGRMVQSLCDDRLHCLCWDDAQSMDAATLETLLSTASRPGLRAVLVCATRDDPPATVTAHPQHHLLSLAELSDDDSARLVSTRVGARILPPELLTFCHERAGGHPLFLEELLKELTDSGAISVMNGAVRARLDGATAVPRTLRTLIASRVSRLLIAERSALQAAAILGDPILTPVLAALLKQSLSQVDRSVGALAGRDFLRVTGPAQAGFASPMHSEIVLDAIPPEARRELHAAAAAAYLSAVGEEGIEQAERVANHLYEAGDRDRAASFYERAALQKLRVNQLEPAIRLLTRALDLADYEHRSAGELAGWLKALAGPVARVRVAPDLVDVTDRALRRIDAVGSLDEKALGRVDAAHALGSVHLFDQAYQRLAEAFTLGGEREDLRRYALSVETEMACLSGDFSRSIRAIEKIEAMGPIQDSRLLLMVAHSRAATGSKEAAVRAIDQADALGRPDDLQGACERAKLRVLVYVYSRDFRSGVEASRRAVDLARSLGVRYAIAVALHNLGEASRRLGDHPRAYASLSESREIAEAAGHERLVTQDRIHLAYLDGLNGAPGAEKLLREFIRYDDSRSYFTDAMEARYLLGALLKHRGAVEEARRELEEVLRMALGYGNRLVADDAREALDSL
jgi:eukaryotic-like serine/threonine-protein kinase